MTDTREVRGCCPYGCGPTPFLAADGYITCSHVACPRPGAVTELLADTETEHIVILGEEVFTIRHPLRERLDDELMNCELHKDLAAIDGPPLRPGTYRVRWSGQEAAIPGFGQWTWELLP